MIQPLINKSDILKYKQISKDVSTDIINPIIISAQITDLSPLLGERLFNDIMSNPSQHTELLEGGNYVYEGKDFVSYGLKAVLVHYFHARYVYFGSNIDTPFGYVNKLNDTKSNPVPESGRKSVYTESRAEAFAYWSNVENYLRRKNYQYFDTGCIDEVRSNNTGFSLTKISRRR